MQKLRAQLSEDLDQLLKDARVTVRRDGAPDPKGKCVVYWMQRAQRGIDNHAIDLAVKIANLLGLPLVVYFAGISNFPHANLRHYVFLNQGCRILRVTWRRGTFLLLCGERPTSRMSDCWLMFMRRF